ncbi:Quinoprotein glucose dehydrogenase B precursor [Stieleria maiorica]|uniref:Quinoprotein glucose dehydrogenase B n=1 Tax=Stieleria maiorica TaxID=2795974 RepID=A0A5B9MI10_9BACT|nr:PQQ-dependent sugar dehydrogenase [Stieleria maiorica]QEG00942.1 Quinoprotein glucose dehydrogenase B precursor [Stieleria maiorica]
MSRHNRKPIRSPRQPQVRQLRCEPLERRELLAVLSGDGFIGPIQPSEYVAQEMIQSAPPSVSITDASVTEGHAGPTTLAFDVRLSAAAEETVTVNFQIANDTADALIVQRIASGLGAPLYVTHAPGEPNTLFVVEKTGAIKKLDLTDNTVSPTPFLVVEDLSTNSERGLLGLAFHPDYETNRRFFVNMTLPNGASLIREYTANANGETADPDSARPLLGFSQPYPNHNGGWIDFGPDGYLYIASGDGGSGNDPLDNAQDITNNLLGKILRIDVDGDDFPGDALRNYAIPPSNPFVARGGDDEIWAYGLRNPWRNSFDRETGDLLIADVGQSQREEINFQPATSGGGIDYGWRRREGTIDTPNVPGSKPLFAVDPIYDYQHGSGDREGNSVTGGYVYRGPLEELHGNYFFGDFSNNRIWSLRPNSPDPTTHDGTNYDDFTDWTDLLTPDVGRINSIASFGEDAAGNLFIVDIGGEIFRISEGADYKTTTHSVMILPGETSATLQVDVIGDRLPEPHETFEVSMTSSVGATIGNGQAQGRILNDDAPTVDDVQIGSGDRQRSIIDSLKITFDSTVQINDSASGAIELMNLDSQQSVTLVPSTAVQNGVTTLTLGIASGPSVESFLGTAISLADGRYRLTIDASHVTIGGVGLDGNGDQHGGDDFTFGTDPADKFFRFFGDSDGDRDVDGQDYGRFGLTFLRPSTDPAFNAIFDSDGDDDVDGQDYGRFGESFLRQLPM